MRLDDLIFRVKEDAEEEKRKLIADHEVSLKEEEAKIDKEISQKKEDFSLFLSKEKERAVSEYRKERKFRSRIALLEKKKELFSEAIALAEKEASSLPISEKKKIYAHKLEEVKDIISGDTFAYAPKGKAKETEEILSHCGVNTKVEEGEVEEGFVIRGKDFSLSLSLSDIVREEVEKDKAYFTNLLFE